MNIKSANIPEEVRRELEVFAAEVERLNRGEVGVEDFKRFRLQQGIYGQRQEDVQMVRTKLPQGRLTSPQLDCLADFAERYSNGILHMTTRQDVQFHFVKIDDVPKGLDELANNEMTTREACGNTVRNITACHKAGTCAEELFDVAPYGRAITDYLLRHKLTQNLPRKFKISLGGCKGCGLTPIHDIGLKAAMGDHNGQEVRGFRVFIGGGLGSSPRSAKLLTEFIPANHMLRMCEAIVAVFDKYGDKKNRNKARFKFVIDKLGLEKVIEHYEEEFALLEGVTFPELEIPEDSIPEIPQFTVNNEFDNDPDFLNWKTRNSYKQKQEGFFNVQIKLLLGDQTSEQARAISKIASNYAGGVVVITVNQNQMIPWVKEDAMGAVFAELKKIGLHKAGTEEIRDITCCPGSETCNLGITASRGLAAELSTQMENGFPLSAELDHLTIKASGCPNSCGQHHIASIGLHGGAKKVNGVLSPHYEIFLGGRLNDESATFGLPVIKIPAKNTPSAVRMLVEHYKEKKNSEETFEEFFDRNGKKYFRDLLTPFKDLADIESAPQSYLDYGSDKKFSLEDRGQGECAGAVTDMIQDHLAESERSLFQGKLSVEKSTFAEAIDHAKRSLISSARALLVTEGMDFDLDIECLKKFQSLVVDMEIVSPKYADLIDHYEDTSAATDEEKANWWLAQCLGLVKECKAINDTLQTDKTLRIRTGSNKKVDIPTETSDTKAIDSKIDLLGVKCPFNYVKTKLKLETMQIGNTLEVLLDDGEPAKNVPRSIQNDGHKVLSLVKENDHFKLIVEKV